MRDVRGDRAIPRSLGQASTMTGLLSTEVCKLRQSVIGHRSDTPPPKSSVAPVYSVG